MSSILAVRQILDETNNCQAQVQFPGQVPSQVQQIQLKDKDLDLGYGLYTIHYIWLWVPNVRFLLFLNLSSK